MKGEVFLMTTGTSLLANFQRSEYADERLKGMRINDPEWSNYFNDRSFLNSLYEFLVRDPKRACAEANAYLSFADKNTDVKQVWLAGTKTTTNRIVLSVLERWFGSIGVQVLSDAEFSGYFESPLTHRVGDFEKDLVDMLDAFIVLARKKQAQGFRVVVLPVGGFKAHVIAAAMAGFISGVSVGYIHEEFREPITFPPHFYLPRGNELKVLARLIDANARISGNPAADLFKKYEQDVTRLEDYGLIECEYRGMVVEEIRLTSRGKAIAMKYKEE